MADKQTDELKKAYNEEVDRGNHTNAERFGRQLELRLLERIANALEIANRIQENIQVSNSLRRRT